MCADAGALPAHLKPVFNFHKEQSITSFQIRPIDQNKLTDATLYLYHTPNFRQ